MTFQYTGHPQSTGKRFKVLLALRTLGISSECEIPRETCHSHNRKQGYWSLSKSIKFKAILFLIFIVGKKCPSHQKHDFRKWNFTNLPHLSLSSLELNFSISYNNRHCKARTLLVNEHMCPPGEKDFSQGFLPHCAPRNSHRTISKSVSPWPY